MERPRITLTKAELDRAEIPLNHILVKMLHTSEGIKTKGGIIIGHNTENTYAEGDSWVADLAECYALVVKVPSGLFFDREDPKSMDWETEVELCEDDIVWFGIIESKNSPEIICEGNLYKSIPYADCYAYQREIWVDKWSVPQKKKTVKGILNGYILCSPCFLPKLSDLDHLSEDVVDKTRGVIKFIGDPVKRYLRAEYSHIEDLRVGDEVLFDQNTPLFYLERNKALAKFDGDNQYWVVPRRRISLILNR
jgi:hypothetical protein